VCVPSDFYFMIIISSSAPWLDAVSARERGRCVFVSYGIRRSIINMSELSEWLPVVILQLVLLVIYERLGKYSSVLRERKI